jgi:hypothetical protein
MESYVKELAKDVVLIQHRELIKEYCVQSDVDFFVMKELKLKVQSLEAELKNTNELYLQSVVDREFLIAKLQALKADFVASGALKKEELVKAAEKKRDDVLRDFRGLNRLLRNYLSTFNAKTKAELVSFTKTFKNRYE